MFNSEQRWEGSRMVHSFVTFIISSCKKTTRFNLFLHLPNQANTLLRCHGCTLSIRLLKPIETGMYDYCCSDISWAAVAWSLLSRVRVHSVSSWASKFWIGWEVPASKKVEIVEATLPTALTRFEKLRRPRHYTEYNTFHQDVCAFVSTCYSGFVCAWSEIMFTENTCILNVWNLPLWLCLYVH